MAGRTSLTTRLSAESPRPTLRLKGTRCRASSAYSSLPRSAPYWLQAFSAPAQQQPRAAAPPRRRLSWAATGPTDPDLWNVVLSDGSTVFANEASGAGCVFVRSYPAGFLRLDSVTLAPGWSYTVQ